MDAFKVKLNVKRVKPRLRSRFGLVEECSEPLIRNYKRKILERAEKYLLENKNKKGGKGLKECFRLVNLTEARVDNQIKLRCRQLPNVIHELRKSILRQHWHDAAALLLILCHPGLKLHFSIILRTCIILLFHHPKSNLDLMQSFLRQFTGYILEEDINKFLKITFLLRKCPLSPLQSGKYIRKTGDYKVTRDAEFENI